MYLELQDGGDALWEWARDARPELFVSSAATEVVEAYSEIMAWVDDNPQFFAEAKSKLASEADGWVAAYARVHGATIVTHERHDPHVKKRVPLGNVCHEFNLPVKDTFEMLRELQVRFGWER